MFPVRISETYHRFHNIFFKQTENRIKELDPAGLAAGSRAILPT